jgi:transposase
VLGEGWSLAAAAEAAGVSERTAWKWVDRYRCEGEAGLEDRPSAPRRVPGRTPAEREEVIVALRQLRFTSPEIAETLGMPLSTVGCSAEPARAWQAAAAAAGRAREQL